MFRIEMLPAGNGDCIWIEYGNADQVHRILIDTGWARTYPSLRERILALPKAERVFELLIITHIDADHIQGSIPLLQDDEIGCTFRDIWYNGWRHLEQLGAPAPGDELGAREGEFVGVLLNDRQLPWNKHEPFGGAAVMVPANGDLPVITLEGGMGLTLLSPVRERLVGLIDTWKKDAEAAGFQPGDVAAVRAQLQSGRYAAVRLDELGDETPQPAPSLDDVLGESEGPAGHDSSAPNGSSISVLAEYDGKRALLAADAWASVLVSSLQRLGATAQKPIQVDTWKLAHHGSWANVSPELVELIAARQVLVSTNGRTFRHPHQNAIDLVLKNKRYRGVLEIVFNYRVETTEPWAAPPRGAGYRSVYPSGVSLLL